MTLTIPTATSIKLRFPEFADVDDAQIEFAIEEAKLEVSDTNWTVGYNVALVYLTAHYVSAAISRIDSAGAGGESAIASESIGRLSITYARSNTKVEAVADDKESTSYGRRYLEMVVGNFSGATII